MEKQIVSVVFDYNVETSEPHSGATRYTYFYMGDRALENGELVVVLTPCRSGPMKTGSMLKVVLVVDTLPSATDIGRATKAIYGTIDSSAFRAAENRNRGIAEQKAWARFEGREQAQVSEPEEVADYRHPRKPFTHRQILF